MAPTSIADRVAQCLRGFEGIPSAAPTINIDELQVKTIASINDELARFKLWAGNIGAHRTGRSSLDYRLRDSSRLREQGIRLIDELSGSLDQVEAILSGDTTPWDEEIEDNGELDAELKELLKDEEFEFESELDQLVVDIADIITSLLRLSMSIRNPAPHDHFMSTEYANAKYYSDFDVRHVEAKFKDAEPDLVQRLGAAISRRRQYFKYRESHHTKLSRGINIDDDRTEGGAKSTVASSLPFGMKDPGHSALSSNELVEDDRSETGLSQTSYATTAPESERLRVPPLPKQYAKGPFECPFCFMIISVNNRLQWKKHVLGDLRPYSCLFKDCPSASKEYHRRHEWMDHVLQKHWKTWRCPASCEGSRPSETRLKQHLQNLHPNLISAEDLKDVLAKAERKRPLDETINCHLCGETLDSLKQYQRHVGKHQVDLALFALPKINNDEDSEPGEMENVSQDDLDASEGSEKEYDDIYTAGHAGNNDAPSDHQSVGDEPVIHIFYRRSSDDMTHVPDVSDESDTPADVMSNRGSESGQGTEVDSASVDLPPLNYRGAGAYGAPASSSFGAEQRYTSPSAVNGDPPPGEQQQQQDPHLLPLQPEVDTRSSAHQADPRGRGYYPPVPSYTPRRGLAAMPQVPGKAPYTAGPGVQGPPPPADSDNYPPMQSTTEYHSWYGEASGDNDAERMRRRNWQEQRRREEQQIRDERLRARREQRMQEEQQIRDERLRARMAMANAEMSGRAPELLRRDDDYDGDAERTRVMVEPGHRDELERMRRQNRREQRMQEEQQIRDKRLRARMAQANAEINGRNQKPLMPEASESHPSVDILADEGSGRRIAEPQAEAQKPEAQETLMERMMPHRRANIGPGSRRHRVVYEDGNYRWE